MRIDCQVLFDIGRPAGGDLVTQAVVALADRLEVTWQFGALNQMLAHFYSGTPEGELRVPQVYPVYTGGRLVGYITMLQNDIDATELAEDYFWPCLVGAELATTAADGYEFIGEPPLTCAMEVDGQIVGLMGYQQLAGPELPTEAINHALRMLMGSLIWPPELHLFLYPVSKGASTMLAGLWIAPRADNMNERPTDDDDAYTAVRNLYYPEEQPFMRRFGARERLSTALEQFPDLDQKEF